MRVGHVRDCSCEGVNSADARSHAALVDPESVRDRVGQTGGRVVAFVSFRWTRRTCSRRTRRWTMMGRVRGELRGGGSFLLHLVRCGSSKATVPSTGRRRRRFLRVGDLRGGSCGMRCGGGFEASSSHRDDTRSGCGCSCECSCGWSCAHAARAARRRRRRRRARGLVLERPLRG
jgi:hypothetical protein